MYEVLEFLKTIIQSTTNDTVKIKKSSLADIRICLQNAQEKIDFLQLESQFQQDELQQHKHHDTHQQRENNQVSNIEVDSHDVPCTREDLHQMQHLSLHFPSPLLDLGKSLSITST